MSISYKNLDKKKLIVYADKNEYEKFMLSINAVYNDDDTWIVSKNNEDKLREFIADIKLNSLAHNIKSRKVQKKYHREVSESEDDTDPENSDNKIKPKMRPKSKDSYIDKELDNKKKEEAEKFEKEKERFYKEENLKKKYKSNDPMLYYKSFNSKPETFKKINNYKSDSESEKDDLESSSYCSSSSEDNFPTPKTPKKRKKYNKGINDKEDYDDLCKEVKHLQRKIYEMELENKKLKSKC